ERDVCAVEEDLGADVGDLDSLTGERHVHHAVRGDGPRVGQFDGVLGGDPVDRAGAAGGGVHLLALRAALADEDSPFQPVQVRALGHARGEDVVETDRRRHHGDRFAHEPPPTATKCAMSLTWPTRSEAGMNSGRTRIPVTTSVLFAAGMTWRNEVSAPSKRTSTQANGVCSGCLGRGRGTHDQDVTVPSGPTSTISVVVSPVAGSYSVGGTMTLPPVPRIPTTLPSRSPVKKAPITGPTDRT